jgi:hypothetical protein
VQDVSFTFTVEHPALWSAEQPNLYEAEIALLNEGVKFDKSIPIPFLGRSRICPKLDLTS